MFENKAKSEGGRTTLFEFVERINNEILKKQKQVLELIQFKEFRHKNDQENVSKLLDDLLGNMLKYEIMNHMKCVYFQQHFFMPVKLILLCMYLDTKFKNDSRLYMLKIYSARLFKDLRLVYLLFDNLYACLEHYQTFSLESKFQLLRIALILFNKIVKKSIQLYVFVKDNYVKMFNLLLDFTKQVDEFVKAHDSQNSLLLLPVNSLPFYSMINECAQQKFRDVVAAYEKSCIDDSINVCHMFYRFVHEHQETNAITRPMRLVYGYQNMALKTVQKLLSDKYDSNIARTILPCFILYEKLDNILNGIDERFLSTVHENVKLCRNALVTNLSLKRNKKTKYAVLYSDVIALYKKSLVLKWYMDLRNSSFAAVKTADDSKALDQEKIWNIRQEINDLYKKAAVTELKAKEIKKLSHAQMEYKNATAKYSMTLKETKAKKTERNGEFLFNSYYDRCLWLEDLNLRNAEQRFFNKSCLCKEEIERRMGKIKVKEDEKWPMNHDVVVKFRVESCKGVQDSCELSLAIEKRWCNVYEQEAKTANIESIDGSVVWNQEITMNLRCVDSLRFVLYGDIPTSSTNYEKFYPIASSQLLVDDICRVKQLRLVFYNDIYLTIKVLNVIK